MKAEPPDIEKIAIDRIRAFREQRKWTQEKLAERAGLTPAAITRIERGVRVPTLRTLAKVAHGFGISPAAFVDVKSEVQTPKLGRHLAKMVSKLEDEDERLQLGAVEIVVAYLRSVKRVSSK